jgi:hypothetical protein
MLTFSCIFNKPLPAWHMKINVFSRHGYWITLITIFVFRKRVDQKSHLVLFTAWLQHCSKECNCRIARFIRGITLKLICLCMCVIHGNHKVSVHLMITVKNTQKRWPSQNTFGMWTVWYWTRSPRTQFGVSINVWKLAGDTLNITCNFLYCNH